MKSQDLVEVRPVTADRWADMVELFGERGASSGCWCMWFRVPPKGWSQQTGSGNRAAMERIVAADRVPGLLAYRKGNPVGWISVAPRSEYERIAGASELAADDGVWSVVCFYIGPRQRGTGIGTSLLAAAVEHARRAGARVLEAYPLDRPDPSNADAFTGLASMFEKAGFREVGRFDRWRAAPHVGTAAEKPLARPPGRPVMRLEL